VADTALARALAAFLLLSPPAWAAPGDVLELRKLLQLDRAQVVAVKAPYLHGQPDPTPPRNGVVLYKVVYETTDLAGEPALASGLLAFPDDATAGRPLPVVSYQHQTTLTRDQVPSTVLPPASLGLAAPAVFLFAARGYAMAAPDYLGLGESPGIHPYCHAETEASAAVDLLRASRKASPQLGITLGAGLFLTGYSQGGSATMALHRRIERDLKGELQVAASAPGAGPYDLSGTTIKLILESPVPASVAELSYLILSMRAAYGIHPALGDVINEPYASALPGLFDGTHAGEDILAALPPTPRDLLRPDAYAKLLAGDGSEPLVQAFRLNDSYDWKPQAPVRLYHSEGDLEVPFRNAEVALARMKELGADVELVDVTGACGPAPAACDHIGAMLPSLSRASRWFDSLSGM
jgi:hypothetical protein